MATYIFIFPPLGLFLYIFRSKLEKHKLHDTTNIEIEQLVLEAMGKVKIRNIIL